MCGDSDTGKMPAVLFKYAVDLFYLGDGDLEASRADLEGPASVASYHVYYPVKLYGNVRTESAGEFRSLRQKLDVLDDLAHPPRFFRGQFDRDVFSLRAVNELCGVLLRFALRFFTAGAQYGGKYE